MHVAQRPGESALFGGYNLAAYDEMFDSPGAPRALHFSLRTIDRSGTK